jgi:prepilin-type N-terminal cleavage/methylation domain-containing protein
LRIPVSGKKADPLNPRRRPRRRRSGYSLFEVMVVVTLMSVILSIVAPSFNKAVEQSKVDIAVANLRSIWAAERFYLVVNPQQADPPAFSLDLQQLLSLGVVDAALTTATSPYSYSVSSNSAVNPGFIATATRTGVGQWQGSFSIDQSGNISGSLSDGSGGLIVPASQ